MSQGYNAAASIQDNILFGKIAYGQARAAERVKALVTEVIDELDLRAAVIEAGLDFHAGIGGGPARRRPAPEGGPRPGGPQAARTSWCCRMRRRVSTGAAHARIAANLFRELEGPGRLIWSLHRADLARPFDEVRGHAFEPKGRGVGAPSTELDRDGSALRELLEAG